MSSRKIKAALKAKGIGFSEVYYDWQATPGEMVGGYTVTLTIEAEDALDALGFDIENDFDTLEDSLEWVSRLPHLKKDQTNDR